MHFWPRQCRIYFFYVNAVQKAHLIKIINILLCSKSVLNESPQKGTQTLHFINCMYIECIQNVCLKFQTILTFSQRTGPGSFLSTKCRKKLSLTAQSPQLSVGKFNQKVFTLMTLQHAKWVHNVCLIFATLEAKNVYDGYHCMTFSLQ